MSILIDLYHGRTDPNADLDDWGFNGPILGPFDHYHVTYNSTCHPGDGDLIVAGVKEELPYWDKNDLIPFLGSYYGDLIIISAGTIIKNNILRERFLLTEEIFKMTKEDLPKLINHETEWVKQYLAYQLKRDK